VSGEQREVILATKARVLLAREEKDDSNGVASCYFCYNKSFPVAKREAARTCKRRSFKKVAGAIKQCCVSTEYELE